MEDESMEKVAIITGGTRGIGLGIARQLAREGYHLVLNGVRTESAVAAVLEELRALGSVCVYSQADIGVSGDRQALLDCAKREFGRCNCLVNNAGVAPKERRDVLEATEESFDWVMGINLKGPYFLTQAVANWLIAQKHADTAFEGCIVNVSSISADIASINRGEYCVSKAGLHMATKLFAARLGPHNIPVYEVRPGVTATDMTDKVKEKYDKLIAEGLCVQPRWGTPKDVGRAVAALVRGDFSYSSGQVFHVDGGLTVPRL